jgi:molybdopterin-biosynthesis enzyme MoeA-like protein
VANPISKAPGFWIGNVIVMAGVPSVMQAMMDDVAPKLVKGAKIISEIFDTHGLPEGAYAADLGALAKAFPDVSIGSYPKMIDGKFVNQIVLRTSDENLLARAGARTREMLEALLVRHRL